MLSEELRVRKSERTRNQALMVARAVESQLAMLEEDIRMSVYIQQVRA